MQRYLLNIVAVFVKKNYLKSSLSSQLSNVLLTYFHFIKFIGLNSIRSSNNNNNLNSNI